MDEDQEMEQENSPSLSSLTTSRPVKQEESNCPSSPNDPNRVKTEPSEGNKKGAINGAVKGAKGAKRAKRAKKAIKTEVIDEQSEENSSDCQVLDMV